MKKGEIIISGPEFSDSTSPGSVAECLIPKMKARGKDHIAQVDGATGESITTQDFLRMSLEVTEGLIEFGVKQGDVVALLSPNDIKTSATAMGVLFSGAIFAPVDHNLKPAEWRHLLKQFQPKYVLCQNKLVNEIRQCLKAVELDPKIILMDSTSTCNSEFSFLDDLRKKVDMDNYTPRKVTDQKKDPAIILCSSGSTGYPKGVALSHYALLYNCWTAEEKVSPADPFVMTSPLFWISGSFLLLISTYVGSMRYVPKSSRPEDVLEGVHKYKPGFLLVSPSSLLQLVKYPDVKKYDLSSLKIVFVSGAPLGSNGAKKVKEVLEDIIILTSYGLTETAGSIINLEGPFKEMVLGSVLPGVQVKVADVNTGESLGPNKTGECRVKTNRVMIGYYNNEEATKAAFDEDGWLRTGDLVYYDENKVFYLVGRIKEVVKCKNFQVSLVELEGFIIGLNGVNDVAVVPIPNEEDTFHLKALVVKDPKSNLTAEDIIRSVEENFSYQKQLHEGVEFVNSLPRSEAGKLKRTQILQN